MHINFSKEIFNSASAWSYRSVIYSFDLNGIDGRVRNRGPKNQFIGIVNGGNPFAWKLLIGRYPQP
jgi:hypothetical protein